MPTNDSPIPSSLIDELSSSSSVDLSKVAINLVTFLGLSVFIVLMFQILRPNNKIVYAPKSKYAEEGQAPPKVSDGFLGWIPPLVKYNEHDLLPLIGLDGVTFLRFIRMMCWMLTTIAVLMSIVLMPVDFLYNRSHPNVQLTRNKLNYVNMSNVGGSFLWAHVAMGYVGTIIALGFIWYNYKQMVRLRWAYFRSEEYQNSFHARTLMITDVQKRFQADEALSAMLAQIKMPYPTTEVHIGRRVEHLPDLIKKHNDLVKKLEHVLAKYLKDPKHLSEKRPLLVLGGFMGFGGSKVDAIDYYTRQINRVEVAVQSERERIALKKPESYGFASLAAVPFAHAAAKSLRNRKPGGMRIELAPPPSGIIWKNLTRSQSQRVKSSIFGFLMLLLLIMLNTFPLLIVSLISNMSALTSVSWLRWLGTWEQKNSFTFSAVSGLGAPVIMGISSFIFPLAMRKIAKYRGVRTRYKLDCVLVGQLFGFLVISQFVIFSLIGVALSTISLLLTKINRESALTIIEELGKSFAKGVKAQYLNQSNYWLTWLPLRVFMASFDLSQAVKLLFVWFQKVFFGRTPRDVREYTKPPVFDYWLYYANFLFITAVAIIYAPLAPIVVIFASLCFWFNLFVYKYQLMYVFVTKHETGGMLWRVVINRLLFCIGFMQIILILAVVLDHYAYLQALAGLPPIVMLIAFKIYCKKTFDIEFDWYIPNEAEISSSKIYAGDSRHNRLQRRFGHPSLHSKLFTPMVHANVKHLLPQVYHGKIDYHTTNVDGRRVQTGEVAGGLKIAAIEEDQLEYDPHKDSDTRSFLSGTTLDPWGPPTGVSPGYTPGYTPGSYTGAQLDYFKLQHANYLAGTNQHLREEFELKNVAAQDSRDNLLEKSRYSDSAEGPLASHHVGKLSPEAYGYMSPNESVMTPGIENMVAQEPTYPDPYIRSASQASYSPQMHHRVHPSQTSVGSLGQMLYGAGGERALTSMSTTSSQHYNQAPPTRPGAPPRSNSGFSQLNGQFVPGSVVPSQAAMYQSPHQQPTQAPPYQVGSFTLQQPSPRQPGGYPQPPSAEYYQQGNGGGWYHGSVNGPGYNNGNSNNNNSNSNNNNSNNNFYG